MTDQERAQLCNEVRKALPLSSPKAWLPEVGVYVPLGESGMEFLRLSDVDGYVLRVGTERNLLFATTGATPEECMGRMRAALEWKP